MNAEIFDRETLLDLTVNAIPLAIILFFGALFVTNQPATFGGDGLVRTIQFGILGTMFVGLFVLTYLSGTAIAEDERRRESAE